MHHSGSHELLASEEQGYARLTLGYCQGCGCLRAVLEGQADADCPACLRVLTRLQGPGAPALAEPPRRGRPRKSTMGGAHHE
jgi:hypothetical protein